MNYCENLRRFTIENKTAIKQMTFQTPIKDELNPQILEGTEGEEITPQTPLVPSGLMNQEKEELEKLRRQFPESSKEAIRLAKRVRELEDKLAQASETPSDKELKDVYPDFEVMDFEQQKKSIEELKEKKRLKIIEAKLKMREDFESLPDVLKEKIKEKGGYSLFRDFACSSDNVGQKNLLNLAKQYLYEEYVPPVLGVSKPLSPGLEPGTGGITPPPPLKEGYTIAELRNMRINEPDKYNDLARQGKLIVK